MCNPAVTRTQRPLQIMCCWRMVYPLSPPSLWSQSKSHRDDQGRSRANPPPPSLQSVSAQYAHAVTLCRCFQIIAGSTPAQHAVPRPPDTPKASSSATRHGRHEQGSQSRGAARGRCRGRGSCAPPCPPSAAAGPRSRGSGPPRTRTRGGRRPGRRRRRPSRSGPAGT